MCSLASSYPIVLDDELVRGLDGLADFLAARKSIQSKPDARAFIDPAPLKAARPEWVKLQ